MTSDLPRSHSNTASLQTHKQAAQPRVIHQDWWTPLWRGLVVDPDAKHFKAIGKAVWLFLYLMFHADRETGVLQRRIRTVAQQMGISVRTVQYQLAKLRNGDYVKTTTSGRTVQIQIQKWKSLKAGRFKGIP